MENKETRSKEIVPAKPSEAELVVKSGKSGSIFFDVARFEFCQRVAQVFASSTMIPEQFKENVGNCIIALNLADRMNVDPFMLMQNMYIIHGKPGIEAKLAIALVNNMGKFTPLQYKYNHDKTSCYAYAKKTDTGETCEGVEVSIQMAKAEGWYSKKGSKWQTIPTLMLMYRSAMFFARAYCPEALLGMQSREELHDFIDMETSDRNGGAYEVKDSDKKDTASASETKTKPTSTSTPVASSKSEINTPSEFAVLVKKESGKDFKYIPTGEDGMAHDNLSAYIEMVALNNDDSNYEDIMDTIVSTGSFPGFWSGFMQGNWKVHFKGKLPESNGDNAPPVVTPEPNESTKDQNTPPANAFDLIDWKTSHMKGTGVSTYFYTHKTEWNDASEESKAGFRDKWARVFKGKEPFPLDVKEEGGQAVVTGHDGEVINQIIPKSHLQIDYAAKLHEYHENEPEKLLIACKKIGYDNIVIPMGKSAQKDLYDEFQMIE